MCPLREYHNIKIAKGLNVTKPDEKKPVLSRVPQSMYDELLKDAADASVARGKQVSVPQLLVEYAAETIKRKKEHK